MWNLSEGTCIRTLVGHTSIVNSIRENSQNNTLMSCSKDGTIKTWDLKTGECLDTIVVENSTDLQDLIRFFCCCLGSYIFVHFSCFYFSIYKLTLFCFGFASKPKLYFVYHFI